MPLCRGRCEWSVSLGISAFCFNITFSYSNLIKTPFSINNRTNITETRFIHQFDGENYFPFLSYVENDWKSQDTMMEVGTLYSTFRIRSNVYIQTVEQEIEQIRNKRRRNKFFTRPSYKIAYQILAHDIASAENIKLLITKLDSKDSIVMIHVDVKSPELRDSLLEFIRDRLSSGRDDNVFLQTRCFGIIWGHVSIVHAQIQGFFELIDLADWEYVINLSAYDWPLKKSSDIYNVLKENGTSSWIEYWKDPESKKEHKKSIIPIKT